MLKMPSSKSLASENLTNENLTDENVVVRKPSKKTKNVQKNVKTNDASIPIESSLTPSPKLMENKQELHISRLRTEYLIQARWKKASILKQVIESIKDLINETNMEWSDNGIHIQGMDPSHITLSNIFMSAEDCEYYHIKESITIGLDIMRISKIMAMTDSNDSCELFIKSEDESSLSIILESQDGTSHSLFEIPLLDIDTEFVNIPDKSFDVEVQIPANLLPTAVREMSFLGDVTHLSLDKNEFQVKVQGDHGKGCRSWSGEKIKIRSTSETFQLPFPTKFLQMALKATNITDILIIEMSEDCPLRICCSFGKSSSIVNFVAPKILEEDEN